MEVVDSYQQARTRARRTSAFRLRRQERRLGDLACRRRLDTGELARLAAVRSELRARGTGEPWPRRLWHRRSSHLATAPRHPA
jgi:hypothetical protein